MKTNPNSSIQLTTATLSVKHSINRRLFRRSLLFIITFCALSLLVPFPAIASEPQVEAFDFIIDHEVIASCGDFNIIADGTGTTRIWTYFDREGNPVRVIIHGLYNGTLTNSVTGFSIIDAPSVSQITVDLVNGTQTNVGAFFTVTIPSEGVVFFDAGRLVFDGNGPPVFIAGQHHPPDESISILCDALQ